MGNEIDSSNNDIISAEMKIGILGIIIVMIYERNCENICLRGNMFVSPCEMSSLSQSFVWFIHFDLKEKNL